MALSQERSDWWRSAVLYQIYPRSFQDSDGDGVGDLQGIIDRLDYLVDLGVDGLWISPFFKSPMRDYGYDVDDHRTVDPLFGSNAVFETLLAEAHARGIRILIDLVLSHTAVSHPWFTESRQAREGEYADRYVWSDPKPDGTPPNNWLSIFGGPAWTWEPRRGQYFLHNFLSTQPDLNFHHPAVRQEALDIARYWLDRGVDGFRLDTLNFYFHDRKLRDNPPAAERDDQVVALANPYGMQDHIHDKNQPEVEGFLDELGALFAEYPGSIGLGEVGAGKTRAIELMKAYLEPGRMHLCYTFDLLSHQFSPAHFRAVIEREQGEGEGLWRCLSFSNHDIMRSATRFGGDQATPETMAPLVMALLLSLRGTPCIYQGEELGLPEADVPYAQLVDPYGKAFWPTFKGRDGCRTPMPWMGEHPFGGFTTGDDAPWLPITPAHLVRAVDQQTGRPGSALEWTRELLRVRRATPALQSETVEVLSTPDPLLGYCRGEGPGQVLCLFNLSDRTASWQAPSTWTNACALVGSPDADWDPALGALVLSPWSWVFLQHS